MNAPKNNCEIHALPVLQDNIIWIWVSKNKAVVIDPSIASPVKTWLEKRNLELIAILQTHHHDDHIGGTPELLEKWPSSAVIASKKDFNRIPFQTVSVEGDQEIKLLDTPIKILDIAAHTKAHIAYFIPSFNQNNTPPAVFCGDTLFGAGCGRIFEGSYEDMYNSLRKIKTLPDNTRVFCAHEYTKQNLLWASSLYPYDAPIKKRLSKVINKRNKGLITLPSSISEEKSTNLFLRAKSLEDFEFLRKHKDNWKG